VCVCVCVCYCRSPLCFSVSQPPYFGILLTGSSGFE